MYNFVLPITVKNFYEVVFEQQLSTGSRRFATLSEAKAFALKVKTIQLVVVSDISHVLKEEE
jgi:hypothetical protein